jgi:hypothetical protein
LNSDPRRKREGLCFEELEILSGVAKLSPGAWKSFTKATKEI